MVELLPKKNQRGTTYALKSENCKISKFFNKIAFILAKKILDISKWFQYYAAGTTGFFSSAVHILYYPFLYVAIYYSYIKKKVLFPLHRSAGMPCNLRIEISKPWWVIGCCVFYRHIKRLLQFYRRVGFQWILKKAIKKKKYWHFKLISATYIYIKLLSRQS